MQTIRRELRLKFLEIVENDNLSPNEMADKLADAALEIRGLQLSQAKAALPLDWKIATGQEITKEDMDKSILSREATNSFEQELHFNPLPWSSNRDWEKFEKWVAEEYTKDRSVWRKYDEWRKGNGKYAAISNKAIKYHPADFIACFPDFLAHSQMYPKRDTQPKLDANDSPMSY